jgi:hypothetical protein
MRRHVTYLESIAGSSARVQNGASAVTLLVIDELDLAGVLGLRRDVASVEGDAREVAHLSRAALIDCSTTCEPLVRDRLSAGLECPTEAERHSAARGVAAGIGMEMAAAPSPKRSRAADG